MARVVVCSMGYRGDVFPFVPIARELAGRGHDVTVVVPREFHERFAAEGLRCRAPGFDIGPTLLDENAGLVRHLGGARLVRRLFTGMIAPHLDELFEALDAEVAAADLVVSHTLSSAVASMACERRGVPMVHGDLFPMHTPSAFVPPVGAPDLGRRGNALQWDAMGYLAARAWPGGRALKAQRRRLGLDPDGWTMVDPGAALGLGLVSPSYVDRQPDWPERYRLVGFSSWCGPGAAEIPDDVAAFLDAGPPPVVVTQGTAAASARAPFFAAAARAVERAGGRTLLLTSTERNAAELRSALGGDRHGVWPFVPLEPLLARCRGALHAGGLGTTALTLAAGVPSAIRPCMIDSVWHARRHEQLGIGVRVRRRGLGRAVYRLLNDGELRDRARQLGQRIAAEDGIGRAVDEIEAFLRAGCPAPR